MMLDSSICDMDPIVPSFYVYMSSENLPMIYVFRIFLTRVSAIEWFNGKR